MKNIINNCKVEFKNNNIYVLLSEQNDKGKYNRRSWLSGFPEEVANTVNYIIDEKIKHKAKKIIFSFRSFYNKIVEVEVTVEELRNPKNFYPSKTQRGGIYFNTYNINYKMKVK